MSEGSAYRCFHCQALVDAGAEHNCLTGDSRQWSWWADEGDEPEVFRCNAATREGAIASARSDYGNEVSITVVEATQDGPFASDIFSVDDDDFNDWIRDRFEEANAGRFGEDGFEGFHEGYADLMEGFGGALRDWLALHGRSIPTFKFMEQRNRETIHPAIKAGNDTI